MSETRRSQVVSGWPIATSLRKRVYLFWAMILMVCLIGVGSLLLVSAQLHRLALNQAPAVEANDHLLLVMTEAQTGLIGFQHSGDRGMLEPFVGAHDRIIASLATVNETLVQPSDGKTRSETIQDTRLDARQRLAAEQWWAYALKAEQSRTQGSQADVPAGRALFERFRAANSAIGAHLRSVRDESRQRARTILTAGVVGSVAVTLLALVAMVTLGGRVASSISRPVTELRDTMARQRKGEQGARAREDQGSMELRSLAENFNALSEQNLALLQTQARVAAMHELARDIEHSIRVAPDIHHTLGLLCAALGDGLGVDRVLAHTIDADHVVLVSAQWHTPDLPPLADLPPDLLADLGQLASELWMTTGVRARDDFLTPEVQSLQRGRSFHHETGARAVIMAPIGLNDRVIGMIYVLMVNEPRAWTRTEANLVQQVAGFVAGAVVEMEYQAHQSEHVERLERLDRHKSDFLATVNHELRTPLTSITGYLEILQDGDVGRLTAEQDGMLEVMYRNTNRLTSLIEDLLVLNRIETDDFENNFVGLSVRQLITRTGLECSPQARKGGITLDIDAGPESLMVHGDRRSLDRAVLNIVSNAIKFSAPGGVVTIRCTMDEDRRRVLVSCQDCGIGIPASEQPQVFTRFYRAKNATDQAIPGTGLGLSIVKQIVEDHGGALRFTSVEGQGTTVFMYLPLSAPVPGQADGSGGGNGLRPQGVFGIRA